MKSIVIGDIFHIKTKYCGSLTSVRVSKAITSNSSNFWVNLDIPTAVPGSQLWILLFQKYFIVWVEFFPIVRFPLQRDVCREFVLLSVNMSFPLCVGLSDNSLAYENYFEKCWKFLINSDNSSPQFQLSVWCTPALHSQWTILLNEEINILSILIYFDVHHCPHCHEDAMIEENITFFYLLVMRITMEVKAA